MQKNASGGQGLFVFYGREPKRPPFGRQGGIFASRSFVPVPPFGGEEGARGAADADFVI